MLEIKLDTSAVDHSIAGMMERIKAFASTDMPAEMMAWQVEDMHRKYPKQEMPDEWSVQTHIWPRSQLKRVRKPMAKDKRIRARGLPRLVRVPGHRPILRPGLFERLHDRMTTLMQAKLKWP